MLFSIAISKLLNLDLKVAYLTNKIVQKNFTKLMTCAFNLNNSKKIKINRHQQKRTITFHKLQKNHYKHMA